jgi:hypothetical protein
VAPSSENNSGTGISRQQLLLMVGRIDANVQALLDRNVNHEERITGLEKTKWIGHGALLIAVAAFATKIKTVLGL